MTISEQSVRLHARAGGKIEIRSRVPLETSLDLSLAYTPGVAEPCRRIHQEPDLVYKYTSRGNMVAIVTDGTAVLGLGDIGAEASLPVMEGKAILFKEFGGVDAFPLCLNTRDPGEIVQIVRALEPTFGGINIEDIAAPACFEIERRLREELSIPVFHDDQHGTAVVTLAALINSLKLAEKTMEEIRIVINGAGAAGIAIARLLMAEGASDIVLADRCGILHPERAEGMNPEKLEMARITNPRRISGGLEQAMRGADVFIGVSAKDAVTQEMVRSMAQRPVVMAMANPDPEILPEDARAAGAFIVCTGRSDFPNQVNNVLAFPGIFRGALDVRAREINEEMKRAAAQAIADMVRPEELTVDYVIPGALNRETGLMVGRKVAQAARESGVARI